MEGTETSHILPVNVVNRAKETVKIPPTALENALATLEGTSPSVKITGIVVVTTGRINKLFQGKCDVFDAQELIRNNIDAMDEGEHISEVRLIFESQASTM